MRTPLPFVRESALSRRSIGEDGCQLHERLSVEGKSDGRRAHDEERRRRWTPAADAAASRGSVEVSPWVRIVNRSERSAAMLNDD